MDRILNKRKKLNDVIISYSSVICELKYRQPFYDHLTRFNLLNLTWDVLKIFTDYQR